MRIVAALGGNAILRRGEPMTGDTQRANIRIAVQGLAQLVAAGHSLVVTHGNGPQVGLLALQSAATPQSPFPLDVLDAESAGMIGYVLQQELGNALPDRLVTTLLTQVRVDPADPAFGHPTKPIGPVYNRDEAHRLAQARGWHVAPDGDSWRRVVASPAPLEILEAEVLKILVAEGVIPICAGGGGIPVVALPRGGMTGVEAVIDKDLASGLLARQIGADMLLMLTDVAAVYRDFGTARARALGQVRPDDLSPDDFPAGSMGPKVRAGCDFVAATGGRAGIGRLEDVAAIVAGRAGTIIAPATQAPMTSHRPPEPR